MQQIIVNKKQILVHSSSGCRGYYFPRLTVLLMHLVGNGSLCVLEQRSPTPGPQPSAILWPEPDWAIERDLPRTHSPFAQPVCTCVQARLHECCASLCACARACAPTRALCLPLCLCRSVPARKRESMLLRTCAGARGGPLFP